MILIGEAGGSKTDWRIIADSEVNAFSSSAFNASRNPPEELIMHLVSKVDFEKIHQIHFYAAGLVENTKSELLKAFSIKFPGAKIDLYPDTLASARALFGDTSGNVGILGTGAAACFYDGYKITNRIPSLGYALGDEGSGFDLGKRLIKAILRNQLPSHVIKAFEAQFPNFSESGLLEAVYRGSQPAAFVASFTVFLSNHQTEAAIEELIYAAFENYFDAFGAVSDQPTWGFSGSIAYHFSAILEKAAHSKNLQITKIITSPIDHLTLYHQTHG